MATLREQVEFLLPGWESWYPTLFDAACDLGLIRARVAPLSSLLLSHRHAGVQNEAVQAFRRQWSVEDDPAAPPDAGADEIAFVRAADSGTPGEDAGD